METLKEVERAKPFLRILRRMPSARHNMVSIGGWLLEKQRHSELWQIVLGEEMSTAPSSLFRESDVCISCAQSTICSIFLRTKAWEDRIQHLLQYRFDFSHEPLSKIEGAKAGLVKDNKRHCPFDDLRELST